MSASRARLGVAQPAVALAAGGGGRAGLATGG
jgi:hypothetical protein